MERTSILANVFSQWLQVAAIPQKRSYNSSQCKVSVFMQFSLKIRISNFSLLKVNIWIVKSSKLFLYINKKNSVLLELNRFRHFVFVTLICLYHRFMILAYRELLSLIFTMLYRVHKCTVRYITKSRGLNQIKSTYAIKWC